MKRNRGILAVTAVMAVIAGGAVGTASAAETTEAGNNLSVPVVFSEGIGLTGSPVATDTGIRGAAYPAVSLTDPHTVEGDTNTYYLQNTANEWQAQVADGSQGPVVATQADWGDNLVRHTWNGESKIRVEVGLTLDQPLETPMVGYEMASLGGSSNNETWAAVGAPADGAEEAATPALRTTETTTPSVYTPLARLTIEKISGQDGTRMGTGPLFSGAVSEGFSGSGPGRLTAEVNASGKVVYGYQWDLSKLDLASIGLPAKPKFGWYRLTFSIDPDAASLPGIARHTSIASLNPADLSADSETETGGGSGGSGGGSGGGTGDGSGDVAAAAGPGGSTQAYYPPRLVDDHATALDLYISSSKGRDGTDTAPPLSHAGGPPTTSSSTFNVSYDATDDTYLSKVDLYAKGPQDTSYQLVATSDGVYGNSGGVGVFPYTATQGLGVYSFYTIATDLVGNVQPVPATPDLTVTLTAPPDTTAPQSQLSGPALVHDTTIPLSYHATDDTALQRVDLYAKGPTDSSYRLSGTHVGSTPTGTFQYAAGEGEGNYAFYSIAVDQSGNTEAAPAQPDVVTSLDVTSPTSAATSPRFATGPTVRVGYAAAGVDSKSSLTLYMIRPGGHQYVPVETVDNPGTSGFVDVTPDAGDGTYAFATAVTDGAGNVEALPARPDTATVVDSIAPTSTAAAQPFSSSRFLVVRYHASDVGTGLARVELWAMRPGSSDYSLIASRTTASRAGRFEINTDAGDGTYRFITIATDRAGNVEPEPAVADAITVRDRTAPALHHLRLTPALLHLRSQHRVRITFQLSERARVQLRVLQRERLLRTLQLGVHAPGAVRAGFNCRTQTGKLLTPGRYRIQVRASDMAGNTRTATLRFQLRNG